MTTTTEPLCLEQVLSNKKKPPQLEEAGAQGKAAPAPQTEKAHNTATKIHHDQK